VDAPGSDQTGPRPLDANERRVLGVLIEKAKTTPDQYPLSLNALVTGCNQKSNRDPVMTLDEEQVMRSVLSLRKAGAMAEVFGSGKIPRYRHLAYEWLGVDKEELAILAELLLRGEQTEGDLRGRASRMDPIPDLDVLRTHLDRLADKGLVVWLSPRAAAGCSPTASSPRRSSRRSKASSAWRPAASARTLQPRRPRRSPRHRFTTARRRRETVTWQAGSNWSRGSSSRSSPASPRSNPRTPHERRRIAAAS